MMRPTLMFAMLLPLAACGNGHDDSPGIQGSGGDTNRSYQASGFTGVELAGPDDVDVRVGSAFSVRAEGDKDTLDRLKIERVGDTLKVGRIRQNGFNWSSGKARVTVTMPRIAAADLAGSGNLSIDRAEGERFSGEIAGSGKLAIGAITARQTKLSIAGSGNVTAAGRTDALDLSIAGSGDVDARGLTARAAEVSIAGSGSARAAVDGQAKVSIMGSGDVDLGPKARCSTSKMGSGKVRCG